MRGFTVPMSECRPRKGWRSLLEDVRSMLRHRGTPTGVSRFLRGGLLLGFMLAVAVPFSRAQDTDLSKGQQPLPGLGLNGPNFIHPVAPPTVDFLGELPAQTSARVMVGRPSVQRTALGSRVENPQPDQPASLVLERKDRADRVRLNLPDCFRNGMMLLAVDDVPICLLPIRATSCWIDMPTLLDLAQALRFRQLTFSFFSTAAPRLDVARIGLWLQPAYGLAELRI